MPDRWLASAGLAAAAFIAAGCGSSSAGSGGTSSTPSGAAATASSPASSGTALKTAKISGTTVLTNAGGFTLYWFAPDTPAKSNCNELQRFVRRVLAAGQGTRGLGPGCHRQARHDHAVRWHGPGHLRRAPSLHLRRRHRPWPGQG